jgi:hypothetical protein
MAFKIMNRRPNPNIKKAPAFWAARRLRSAKDIGSLAPRNNGRKPRGIFSTAFGGAFFMFFKGVVLLKDIMP